MKVETTRSFDKDIFKLRNKALSLKVLAIIEDLEAAKSIFDIPHVRKMNAKGEYYRIKIGDYRLGLKMESNTALLIRFMDRKDIYKYFP